MSLRKYIVAFKGIMRLRHQGKGARLRGQPKLPKGNGFGAENKNKACFWNLYRIYVTGSRVLPGEARGKWKESEGARSLCVSEYFERGIP